MTRNGFRSRLENIVRGQVSSHSETSSNNNNADFRSDQPQANPSQEVQVQHENNEQSQIRIQENDIHQSSNGNLESNIAAQSINEQAVGSQGGDWQDQVIDDDRENWQQPTFNEFNEWGVDTAVDMDGTWQENPVNNWPQQTTGNDGEAGNEGTHEVWQEDASQGATENWSEGPPTDTPRIRRSVPLRRINRFHPPDDDNVYSMELRELLSRSWTKMNTVYGVIVVCVRVLCFKYC